MPTDRAYLATSEYENYSNRDVTNETEWLRQASRAEEAVDDFIGPWPRFHIKREIQISSASGSTFTSADLTDDKDDFYNGLRVRVLQGPGSGYSGLVSDYDGATEVLSVDPSFSTLPTSASIVTVEQPGFFPRSIDRDPTGRPLVPDAVKRAVSAVLEYWDVVGGDAGYNADVFNSTGGKLSESIGSYSVNYDGTRSGAALLGQKAVEILTKAGLVRRTGSIV